MQTLTGLLWRHLLEYRQRTILTGLAVSFGAAMILAADLVGTALLDTLLAANVEGAAITHGFMAEQFDQVISVVGYGLMAAAGFLVFNAFTMTISQRQGAIGLLRSLGMTGRQVRRLVLGEGLLLGAIGVGAGLLAGPLLGLGVIALLNLILGDYLSLAGNPAPSSAAVAQATLLGLGVTFVSVWWPAHRASRVTPLTALRRETTTWRQAPQVNKEPSRLSIIGLGLIGATATYVLAVVPGDWADPPTNTWLTVGLTAAWLAGWVLMLPLLILLVGKGVRRWSPHRGTYGRLIGDNLQRESGRVMLTIMTLALGLVMIVGMTGFMTFAFDELFGTSLRRITEKQSWAVFPFDLSGGILGVADADSLLVAPDDLAVIEAAMNQQATVAPVYFALVPEISFLGDSYFSYVLDPAIPRQEPAFFEFSQGDWAGAWPLLQEGCGLLVTPAVARRNGVGLYGRLTLTTPHGPLDCTVAGIGRPFMNASIISRAVIDYFDLTAPVGVAILPRTGVPGHVFNAQMAGLRARLPHLWPTNLVDYAALVNEVVDLFAVSLNVLLLLVILAAAFGVVNTVVLSVIERRSELGLLRAVGATRRQTQLLLIGEAALMGLLGGFLGLVMGAGLVVILVLVYGGRSWGIVDLDLWAAASRTLRPALVNGVVGFVATPFIAGLAAWLPLRSLLRGSAVEALQPGARETAPVNRR